MRGGRRKREIFQAKMLAKWNLMAIFASARAAWGWDLFTGRGPESFIKNLKA